MPDAPWIESLKNVLQDNVLSAPEMAAFGFAMAVALVVFLGALVLRFVVGAAAAARTRSQAVALRRDTSPGQKILLATPVGRKGKAFGGAIASALEAHLAKFNFGAPFRIAKSSSIAGGQSPGALAIARRRLAQADADLIIWGQRLNDKAEGLALYMLSRGGGLRADEARLAAINCSGKASAWDEAFTAALTYILAKRLQPGLGNPGAFRPEKTKLLSSELEGFLEGQAALTPVLQSEIEADFCAAAVHVAEKSGDMSALEKVIALRREHLAPEFASDPQRTLQARIDLGRALIAKADANYDAAVLQEAIRHLSVAVDALRDDPMIEKAQSTADAMFKAQTMIDNRKRFSLNYGS